MIIICRIWVAAPRDEPVGGMLDATENLRAARFKRHADRQRFVTGRTLAKSLVAEMANVEPRDVSLVARCAYCGSVNHGKPHAIHPRGTHPMSISHSGAVVLAAATAGSELGLDVEEVDASLDHARLGRHIESSAEQGTICTSTDFYSRWTAKEAVLKCTGDGLMVSMRNLTIGFAAGEPVLVSWAGRGLPRITLRSLELSGPFVASLAVATDAAFAVEVRDLRLEASAN